MAAARLNLIAQDRAQAWQAKRSLKAFLPLMWQVVEPGTRYRGNWHIDAMCEFLESVTAGEIKRIVINIPPGHMKSRCVTVGWPCWEWISKPHLRYLCASYAQSLADDHNGERRAIVKSDWYQRHWGNVVEIRKDDDSKTSFSNTARGRMMSTGVGGTATGKGGERLIVDDPLNPKQADSDKERESAELWFRRTLPSRLRNEETGAIVVVMQRLHERDTSALAIEQGYTHLCLPAEYDPSRSKVHIVKGKPWKDPREDKGDLIWPERMGRDAVDRMKVALGSYAYAGQYQQSPHPEGGGVFKREWFRYYRWQEGRIFYAYDGGAWSARVDETLRFTTIDLAFSQKESADYTVIATWAYHMDSLILLDLIHERLEAHQLADRLRVVEGRWDARVHWIEEGAYKIGEGTMKYLRSQGFGIRRLGKDQGASKDKYQRAMDTQPRFESGSVLFPQSAPWLSEFESELLAFPNAAHDDQVDVVSYGVAVSPWGGVNKAIEFSGERRQAVPSYAPRAIDWSQLGG